MIPSAYSPWRKVFTMNVPYSLWLRRTFPGYPPYHACRLS
nr:MAG TPA: hypothetical protein [Caudoviricetes sp.]